MNMFKNIITAEFKQLYNDAIDALLDPSSGLVNPCIIRYGNNPSESSLCNNCIFDSISHLSSNVYNNTGPMPFAEGGVCPVCLGKGLINSGIITKQETVNIAVIVDAKSFINVADITNIRSNVIQTICSINLMNKLQNAVDIVVHGIAYQKMAAAQPCGLAEHKYISMLWKEI